MFKDNSIRKRVLAILEQKLEHLQKVHDEECKRLDQVCKEEKASHGEKLINEIVNKFL